MAYRRAILGSLKNLTQAIDLIAGSTLVASLDGRILYLPRNDKFLSNAKLGSDLCSLIHGDDCEDYLKLQFSLPREQSGRIEARLDTDSSQETYALISFRTIEVDDETLILAQFTDITEQRLREKQTQRLEKLWNDALTTSGAGVWELNLAKGTTFCSDTWRKIRGIAEDRNVTHPVKKWVKHVHPDDRAKVIHCVEQQNKGNPDYNTFTYRLRHNKGHYIWIESRGSCVERDEDGNPVRISGTDTDVTIAMEDRQERERLSRRLKVALDVAKMGVFEANFETRVTTWDARTYEIFEIDPSTVIKMNGVWDKLIHPDDLNTVIKELDEHNERMEGFHCVYRAKLRSGREIYVESRTQPFVDTDGARKLIGTAVDITDEVLLRKELEHSKALLEEHNRELIEARNSIEHNALHDYLTDLPNRRYLDQQLSRMAQQCESEGLQLAILHIDLDRFKEINDTLGHHMGDIMLQHAADILRSHRQAGDFVARIGGDEFVFVVQFKGSKQRLTQLADSLIETLRKPVQYDNYECRFGASVGIATSPNAIVDYKQLLLNADIALYNAKKSGRNRFEYFSEAKQDSMINTKRVSDEILLALERDEFIPFYQLQFDAKNLNISGVETLARWQHPTDGIVTPERFLDIAQDLDVMANLDALILEKSLMDLRKWQAIGLNVPRISVNVSARRLYDRNLLSSLEHLNIKPGEVYFELLESIFLDDNDEVVQRNLQGLRDMKIGIEIDDFGTGHASIVSLLKVAPSTIKVDRQIVHHATASAQQRKLLTAIIEMGHSLGITVLGEGVETCEQITILRELGCDGLQGYALCKPMPADEMVTFIQAQPWRPHLSAQDTTKQADSVS